MRALGGETVYEGRLLQVRVERFRHDDGGEVTREGVAQPVELAKGPPIVIRPNEVAVAEPIRGLFEPVVDQGTHRKHSSRL